MSISTLFIVGAGVALCALYWHWFWHRSGHSKHLRGREKVAEIVAATSPYGFGVAGKTDGEVFDKATFRLVALKPARLLMTLHITQKLDQLDIVFEATSLNGGHLIARHCSLEEALDPESLIAEAERHHTQKQEALKSGADLRVLSPEYARTH